MFVFILLPWVQPSWLKEVLLNIWSTIFFGFFVSTYFHLDASCASEKYTLIMHVYMGWKILITCQKETIFLVGIDAVPLELIWATPFLELKFAYTMVIFIFKGSIFVAATATSTRSPNSFTNVVQELWKERLLSFVFWASAERSTGGGWVTKSPRMQIVPCSTCLPRLWADF